MHSVYPKISMALILSLYCLGSQAADLIAGKTRAIPCQGCHGSVGITTNPAYPNLAGQTPAYLTAELKNFKSGARSNPMMQPFTAGLNDSDIDNLAAYFASLPSKAAGGDDSLAKQGKDKAAMCMGCHGQNLTGNAQIPRLAGQQARYLVKQLSDFKMGSRKSGPMNAISKNLSDYDMKAITAYLSSLSN